MCLLTDAGCWEVAGSSDAVLSRRLVAADVPGAGAGGGRAIPATNSAAGRTGPRCRARAGRQRLSRLLPVLGIVVGWDTVVRVLLGISLPERAGADGLVIGKELPEGSRSAAAWRRPRRIAPLDSHARRREGVSGGRRESYLCWSTRTPLATGLPTRLIRNLLPCLVDDGTALEACALDHLTMQLADWTPASSRALAGPRAVPPTPSPAAAVPAR